LNKRKILGADETISGLLSFGILLMLTFRSSIYYLHVRS